MSAQGFFYSVISCHPSLHHVAFFCRIGRSLSPSESFMHTSSTQFVTQQLQFQHGMSSCSSKYKQDQIQLLGNGQPHYPAFGDNLHIICRQTQNIKCPTLLKKNRSSVEVGIGGGFEFSHFLTDSYYPRLRSQASSHTIKLTALPTCTVFFHVHQPKHLL